MKLSESIIHILKDRIHETESFINLTPDYPFHLIPQIMERYRIYKELLEYPEKAILYTKHDYYIISWITKQIMAGI